jgi:hypothetical protein
MVVMPMGFARGAYRTVRGNAAVDRGPLVAVQPRRRRSGGGLSPKREFVGALGQTGRRAQRAP